MRDSKMLFFVFAAIGALILGAFYYSTTKVTQGAVYAADLATQGGPKLEIVVEGEANGTIMIQLFEEVAPQHVERIVALAESGAYDGVVFHRVIDKFMAQTGDVEFGKSDGDTSRAGMGGSDMADLPAEFSDLTFERGVVGMARSSSPNSANSQFFIMFSPASNLNGQYTIVGQVAEGIEVLDAIKRGEGGNGAVIGAPDVMTSVRVVE